MINPFDWRGTASRKAFWLVLIAIVLSYLAFEIIRGLAPEHVWAIALIMAVVQLFYWAIVVRRLHDMARTGFWGLLHFVPLVQFGFMLWLGLAKGQPQPETVRTHKLRYRIVQGLLLLMFPLAISRAFWAPYWIPAGSMKPALLVGDFVIVRAHKAGKMPARGDILVFEHPSNGTTYIKRLIGLPGDRVQMQTGDLYLNDSPVSYEAMSDFSEIKALQGPMRTVARCQGGPVAMGEVCAKGQRLEGLGDDVSYPVLDIHDGPADTTIVFEVPAGTLFFLGDNRDNSLDSRFPRRVGGLGTVPVANVIGKAEFILFSSAGSSIVAFWTWRRDRMFKRIR